jgi:PPK2 family polyphosphate:nucleotide phosphotransferase
MMSAMVAPLHRLPPGRVDLTRIPTDATPGFEGDKKDGQRALAALGEDLADLQERLWAEGTRGSQRRLLLVLQGMDTSGKGGVLRHTVGLVDPQGVRITSFKSPTPEELEHDFLWRIRPALPEPGYLGVFDRSHYEDVLIVRVHGLVDAKTIEKRYTEINEFEAGLVAEGFVIVKCMLHVSAEQQRRRLLRRLDTKEKHWKFSPADIDERARWSDYRTAYQVALARTNTDVAPWYVVPADRKWYRNLVVGRLLLDHLRGMDLQWPPPDCDLEEQRRRLLEEDPVS